MIAISRAYININETYSGAMKGMRRRTKFNCGIIFAVNTFGGSVIDQRLVWKYERRLVRQGKHNLLQDHESRNPD